MIIWVLNHFLFLINSYVNTSHNTLSSSYIFKYIFVWNMTENWQIWRYSWYWVISNLSYSRYYFLLFFDVNNMISAVIFAKKININVPWTFLMHLQWFCSTPLHLWFCMLVYIGVMVLNINFSTHQYACRLLIGTCNLIWTLTWDSPVSTPIHTLLPKNT